MKAATPHATSADAEIYADLVETLFDTTETLVAGIIAGLRPMRVVSLLRRFVRGFRMPRI